MKNANDSLDVVKAPVKEDMFQPDVGLSTVLWNKSDPAHSKLYIRESPDKRFRLNYVGKVIRKPHPHALPLCEAFGIRFYMEGSKNVVEDISYYVRI